MTDLVEEIREALTRVKRTYWPTRDPGLTEVAQVMAERIESRRPKPRVRKSKASRAA